MTLQTSTGLRDTLHKAQKLLERNQVFEATKKLVTKVQHQHHLETAQKYILRPSLTVTQPDSLGLGSSDVCGCDFCLFVCLVCLFMWFAVPGPTQEPEVSSGCPMWMQKPKDLHHFLLLSQVRYGAGLEVE